MLLLPFTLIYRVILYIRHWLYDKQILASYTAPVPVIIIGNLCVGGSGKTPHTLLFGHWLSASFSIAFLSRGYGRKGTNFRWVDLSDVPQITGDEPRLFKRSFSNAPVAVCAARSEGIIKIMEEYPDIRCILLDDAFQHRKLSGGMRVLLIPYSDFFSSRYLLPAGYQRDVWSRYKAAQCIVVTQCAEVMQADAAESIYKQLPGFERDRIYFSRIDLSHSISFDGHRVETTLLNENGTCGILLVCGIARPTDVAHQLKKLGIECRTLFFADHHQYSMADLDKIERELRTFTTSNVKVLTTSKDREKIYPLLDSAKYSYWFSLEMDLHIDREADLKKILTDYVRQYS